MIDPTLTAAACAALETSINKALLYDPATRHKLKRLSGKSLVVEIAGTPLSLGCLFEDDEVIISQHIEEPTTRLTGSVAGLLQLAMSKQVNLAESGVQAWGSTALLVDLQALMGNLDLDWEEAINDILGDLLGHSLASSVRSQLGWVKERGKNGKRLLKEFLTEELQAMPSQTEMDWLSDSIDQLRLAADRAEARLQRLKTKYATHTEPTD